MARGRGTHNPYTPDSGVRPPALTGRENELAHFHRIIDELGAGGTEKHLLITGLRGVGKTVLLNEFEAMCQEAGWPAEAKEVGRNSSIAVIVGRVVKVALIEMSLKKRIGERLKTAMGALKSFEVTLPDDVSFRLDPNWEPAPGRAESGDLADDLRDLLVAVGQAAIDAGVGFALILDEIQNLTRDDYEALIMALHRAKQKGLPIAFVGAGLPLIPRLTSDAKSYAERMFVFPTIGALNDEAASEALTEPAAGQGVDWQADAVSEVVDVTEGYPYFLQEYGRHAWARNSGPVITTGDVSQAQILVTEHLDTNFFEPRIGKLNDSERSYVSAMAELGDGPQRSAEVAARLGRGQQSVSPVRDALIESAIIYAPRRGYVDFTVPHCAPFVRRRYPLD